MRNSLAKNAARRLMAFALLISPAESREWAAAMSAELEHVEGSFNALSWAAGCLGTALKQLCLSLFSPRKHVSDSSDRQFFAGAAEVTMTKTARTLLIAFAVASLLFLFAPTFRQALRVTAGSWRLSDSAWLASMRSLGAKAEAGHDAQTLAYVAMQLNGNWDNDAGKVAEERTQRDTFADEAVTWDPQLIWIYYSLLARDYRRGQGDPNDARWLARLQEWDPNDGVVYSLEASYHRPEHALGWNSETDRALLANSPEWLESMGKAFSATSYDSYLSRRADLDREVTHRHGLDDPGRLLSGFMEYPMPDLVNFHLYAKYFLLREAADFEAKGDLNHAQEDYEKVARLGGLMQLDGSMDDIETMVGIALQMDADPPFEAMLEKSGNTPAAKLLAFQTDLQRALVTRLRIRNNYAEFETLRETTGAYLLQQSLLGMAISVVLILCCGLYLAARRLTRLHRAQGAAAFARMGVAGAILLFASTVAMYFGYSTYATAFRDYLSAPHARDAPSLLYRFAALQELPPSLFDSFQRIYLWYTIIALGGAIIAWILFRYIARTFHPHAPVQPTA
ncbi:MAG: hypothetical protein WBD21_09375 [Candidatus Acidiferrales bacterium]